VRPPFAESPEFRRLVEGSTDVDLVRVGLEVAADVYPGLDPAPYLARLDELAERVRGRTPAPGNPLKVLEQVNWVLFVEEEYKGNEAEYQDPRNSYLNEVIDRKTGIPISLSLVYQRVAGASGVPLAGVNLPGHFVLRTLSDGPPVFVDPYHGGAILDRAGCGALLGRLFGREVVLSESEVGPCGPPEVVARLLRNLKFNFAREGDYAAALVVQRRLSAVAPGVPEEDRDLALFALRTDRPAEAVGPLQRFLEARPDGPEADDLRAALRAARRDAAGRN